MDAIVTATRSAICATAGRDSRQSAYASPRYQLFTMTSDERRHRIFFGCLSTYPSCVSANASAKKTHAGHDALRDAVYHHRMVSAASYDTSALITLITITIIVISAVVARAEVLNCQRSSTVRRFQLFAKGSMMGTRKRWSQKVTVYPFVAWSGKLSASKRSKAKVDLCASQPHSQDGV